MLKYWDVLLQFKQPEPVKSENLQLFYPPSRNSREFPRTGYSAPRNWTQLPGIGEMVWESETPHRLLSVRSFTSQTALSSDPPAAAASSAVKQGREWE